MWNPVTQAWTMLAAEAEDRCYHSTALLLPDGRLFSAGGGEYLPNGQPIQPKHVHTTAQIFSPPYLFRGPRPQIEDAPPQALLGSRLTVRFSGATPGRASLVRTGSVTHAMDTNQRFVELTCEFQGRKPASPCRPIRPPARWVITCCFCSRLTAYRPRRALSALSRRSGR